MKIEKIKINKLKPAEYNPRQISKKQYKELKQSIEKFGLVDPIIINENGYIVIGGHQRLKICKELKYKEVGCVILNLSKEKERELNIRLNKNTGEFDFDLLANQFEIEELTDWGFKEIELGLNIDKIEEDLSDKIELQYKIEVEVTSEREQEELYNELTKKGYKCRILTL
jgi:ParB/RepB/Spo0J family partition protein